MDFTDFVRRGYLMIMRCWKRKENIHTESAHVGSGKGKDMTDKAILTAIYNNLIKGGRYGKLVKDIRYPYFRVNLCYVRGYFHWSVAGSSANEATLEDLTWIIEKIFKLTPKEFVNRYELRYQGFDYCDDAVESEVANNA